MSTPDSRSRPVLILGGVAAGSLVLATGLPPLTPDQLDWIGPAIGLTGATITAVLTFITQGKVTPVQNVEARRLDNGRVVAGEASPIKTGEPVDVTPTGATNWGP